MRPFWIVTLPFVLALIYAQTIQAEAAPFNTFVSLKRSETSAISSCITVRDLIKYDNSTQAISGKFVERDGDYIREKGMKNSHNYYNIYSGKVFVFVDPDDTTLVRSKQIILDSSLSEFAGPGRLAKKSIDSFQDTRTTYKGAYVDPKCATARVNPSFYPDLGVIIAHMASGCQTDIGNKMQHVENKTKISYCGKECQHQKWLKDALEKSKKNLLGNKK